jgi:hypothetical protein
MAFEPLAMQCCFNTQTYIKEEIMFNFFKGPKAIATQEPIISKKLTKDIREQWKAHAAARKITKEDIAALCIYRALIKEQMPEGAKSRLHKAFQPITNARKLANGTQPYGSLDASLNSIKYSIFAQWLDKEEMQTMLDAAKETKASLK